MSYTLESLIDTLADRATELYAPDSEAQLFRATSLFIHVLTNRPKSWCQETQGELNKALAKRWLAMPVPERFNQAGVLFFSLPDARLSIIRSFTCVGVVLLDMQKSDLPVEHTDAITRSMLRWAPQDPKLRSWVNVWEHATLNNTTEMEDSI